MTNTKNRLLIIGGLLATLYGLVFIWRASVVIDGVRYFALFDDAMISMRYAWNLAQGNGLVYNAGEYVEGMTNFLQTLIMALPLLVLDKSSAVLTIHLFGLACYVLAGYQTYRLMEDFQATFSNAKWLASAAFLGILLYYPLAYWSLLGMETGPLTLVLVLAVRRSLRPHPQGDWLLGLLLGLAFWLRPDSLVFSALIVAYRLYQSPWPLRANVMRFGRETLPFILLVLGLTGFRLAYYGAIVPNTYALKVEGMPFALRLADGLAYTGLFIGTIAVLLLPAFAAVILLKRASLWSLFALVGAGIAYQIYVGGDAWVYWRLLTPTMPLLWVLALLGLERLLRPFMRALQRSMWVMFVLISYLSANSLFLTEQLFFTDAAHVAFDRDLVRLGLLLQQTTTPEARIALLTAGIPAYYSERFAIDMLGKSDPVIAHLAPDLVNIPWEMMRSRPGHNKYDIRYSVWERQADYVQTLGWGNQDLSADSYPPFICLGTATSCWNTQSSAVRLDALGALYPDAVFHCNGQAGCNLPPASPTAAS